MHEWICKKCGSVSLHTKNSGNNVGIYCADCGAWLKWLGKDEQRAFECRTETQNKNLDSCKTDLRKCSGYYTTREKNGWCKHEFANGRFHQFGSDFEEFETGAGNYSTAIVELENGQVVEAVVSSIKFER